MIGVKKHNVCMIVQDKMVQGGIASVTNGYRGSILETHYNVTYIESYKDGSKMTKLIKAIHGYLQFLHLILVKKPEVVHIHSSFGPSFYRKIPYIEFCKMIKIPIVNHCHGADFNGFYISAGKVKKWLIKKIYNKCDIIIALSEEWKVKLGSIVPLEKIKVIENYSVVNCASVKERFVRPLKKQVLFLGQIGQRKGCYDIPKVIGSVVDKIPDIKFIIAGDGEKDRLKKILHEKKLDKQVQFPGWIRNEKKDKVLRESALFFLPSYDEGMPMAILDAMGYGLPIVSTNVGGIPQIVHEGENGYLYNPGDVEGFSQGIIKLICNPDLNKKFSKNSYEIVKDNYSLEHHISLIEDVYDSLIN